MMLSNCIPWGFNDQDFNDIGKLQASMHLQNRIVDMAQIANAWLCHIF